MKTKLTKTEKRAAEFCAQLIQNRGGSVSVDWAKSATWGMNPTIRHLGEKCCQVSGCGYDKLSTALAGVLRFLFPQESQEHSEVWQTGGAGESTTERTLAKYGWTLKKVASGKTYDCYDLRKVGV